jgi:hypothetical protein
MTQLNDAVPTDSVMPFNVGLSSATQETMTSCLGWPKPVLTTADQPTHASAPVQRLLQTASIANVHAIGIKPAIDSLASVLTAAFAETPPLKAALRSAGMLAVRLRRPTSGAHSDKISNHAWGTAIDLHLLGHDAPGATGSHIPYFIALLVPHFNAAGWYSGIAFHDDMHFELADQTIHRWAEMGAFTG